MRLKPLDQQVGVLLGASSGIGRETALRMAARGARLVVAARSAEGLATLVEEIRGAGGEATAVTADVTNYEQVQALAAAAVERYGRLDTWVHLAGVGLFATFEETTPEEFRRVIEVNLIGQMHGAKAALPHLARSGGGALIMISSVAARRAMPYHSAYAASKHGVHGLLDALRMELRHAGVPVAVTEVLPSAINTPFFDKSRTRLGVKPMGLPPIYPTALVADAILHAAQHPTRELVVGSSGQAIVTGQRISPRLMDALLDYPGFHWQKTQEPKGPEAPDNLYGPVSGHDRSNGSFNLQATAFSCSRLLQRGAFSPWGLAALAVGAAMLLSGGGRRERG